MYGLPGQSVESWRESVSVAMDMRPEHLSAYSLMFEEGQPLVCFEIKVVLISQMKMNVWRCGEYCLRD